MPKATVHMFAAPTERKSRSRSELPRAPEVDEEALARAEAVIEPGAATASPPTRVDPVSSAAPGPRRRRRLSGKPEADVIFIKGPKPVIDAFNAFKEREQFRGSWQALEHLLISYGIEIEDFDV